METTLPKQPLSEFLHPRAELAQCILGGFLRDTRGCDLAQHQRFNHFSASPLCAVSLLFAGTGRILTQPEHFETPLSVEPMGTALFSGPQSQPTTSWNDGDINALVVVFYPDAISAMLDRPMEAFLDRSIAIDDLPDGTVFQSLQRSFMTGDAKRAFEVLQSDLAPIWRAKRPTQSGFGRMMGDWSRSLMLNAALSNSGRSLRQMQRRVKAATGQPLKRLQNYAKAEDAFVLALKEGSEDIAGIAMDAGYSDQSHMGRYVRAQTGFTPTQLLRGYESDEAFWSYRLMGERY